MIPDGTPPEVIVPVVIIVTLIGCALMAALFWYRFPEAGNLLVKRFWYPAHEPHSVMSRAEARTERTNQTNERTNEQSAADQWLERMKVDRTKMALIDLTVYSGWTVAEIRNALKGESSTLGTEIESARKRLGLAPSAEYRTPIANRPTGATFQDTLN